MSACDNNYDIYRKYNQALKNAPSYIEYEEAFNIFKTKNKANVCLERERSIINSEILRIPYTTTFKVIVEYITPAGKKIYQKSRDFSVDEMRKLKSDAIIMETDRNLKKINLNEERTKMTESLRYDVFKRDNFKCTICGRGSKDGVKLQVDHIKPVSKGGKTVLNNLRTLCDECNRGKRDKYDQNGCN